MIKQMSVLNSKNSESAMCGNRKLSKIILPGTLGPYCFRVTTSGAIQYGVPTIVVLLLWSGVIWAQKPKSAEKVCGSQEVGEELF